MDIGQDGKLVLQQQLDGIPIDDLCIHPLTGNGRHPSVGPALLIVLKNGQSLGGRRNQPVDRCRLRYPIRCVDMIESNGDKDNCEQRDDGRCIRYPTQGWHSACHTKRIYPFRRTKSNNGEASPTLLQTVTRTSSSFVSLGHKLRPGVIDRYPQEHYENTRPGIRWSVYQEIDRDGNRQCDV